MTTIDKDGRFQVDCPKCGYGLEFQTGGLEITKFFLTCVCKHTFEGVAQDGVFRERNKMRVGTQCDDMGLFIPLMIFKSEVIGMSKEQIEKLIEVRMVGMLKEAKEKCGFLQKDVTEEILKKRINEMARERCESLPSKTSSPSNG